MARFSKPDRRSPSERAETGIPDRDGPPPDSGEEGDRLDRVTDGDDDDSGGSSSSPSRSSGSSSGSSDPSSGGGSDSVGEVDTGRGGSRQSEANLDDVTPSDNPGIDEPAAVYEQPDFPKPDRRGPTERAEQERVARQTPGLTQDDISRVERIEQPEGPDELRAELEEQTPRERFEANRERARREADVDAITRLGAFDTDEIRFDREGDAIRARATDEAAQRRRRQLEEQRGELIAGAEVEQEPDRPLADRFEAATGIEVPTQRELFSTPRAAAGRAGSTLRELGIPTSTGGVRGGIERQLGIEFPDSEAEFLSPVTERADEAVGFVDFDELPTDSDEFSAALERETGVDIPSQREVVNPIRSAAIDAGSAVADFDRNFAPGGPEFGLERSGSEPRFDRGDVADFGRESVETAIEINDRFTVPGHQGFGTVDPNVDENQPSGPPDLRGAAVAGVAAPEPATSVGGAAILGGLFLGGIAFDTVRRRGELGIGDGSTEVQEVEVGETELAEIEPAEQARGTQEVGLGEGVFDDPEVGLGDARVSQEIDVARSSPMQQQRQREEVVIDVPEVEEELERQRRSQEGIGLGEDAVGIPIRPVRPEFPQEREFPTGAGAVVGREVSQIEESQSRDVSDSLGEQTAPELGEEFAPSQRRRPRGALDVDRAADVGLRSEQFLDELAEQQQAQSPRLGQELRAQQTQRSVQESLFEQSQQTQTQTTNRFGESTATATAQSERVERRRRGKLPAFGDGEDEDEREEDGLFGVQVVEAELRPTDGFGGQNE